jgi:uncharacterized protein
VIAALLCAAVAAAPLRVLIVDGINNHDWEPTTAALRTILEDSARPIKVEVSTTPARDAPSRAWDAWRPDFKRYDAVVSNWNGGHKPDGVRWPRDVETAFESYVREGGGFVSFHAANNAFLEWPAYNEMVGLLWRDPAFGPGLVVDAEGKTVIVPAGEGRRPGHGPRHDFEITVFDCDHPITRGLPARWLHPSEQLTHGQHGPTEAVRALHVLTHAWSKDVEEREPMDWVHPYGQGRVYVTMLGHTWKGEPSPNLESAGFRTLFRRGVEWAATGAVTIPVPAEFPSPARTTSDRAPAAPR